MSSNLLAMLNIICAMTNKKGSSEEMLGHLNDLVAFCLKAQNQLLKEGRTSQHDFVIVNLFNIAQAHPRISLHQLMSAYDMIKRIHHFGEMKKIKFMTMDGIIEVFETKPLI